jgi:uncharacterized protein
MNIQLLETQCHKFVSALDDVDGAHDISHVQRVVNNARRLLQNEAADEEITLAAAWLHDCVVIPKNHPERHRASELAATKATSFLREIGFDEKKSDAVAHAIQSHSFSAGIRPETPEAGIVQDADRLDALGAIGIARCFTVGGKLGRTLYAPQDPFCEKRDADDSEYTLDHFYAKLFKLPEMMNTKTGAGLARERVYQMKEFLDRLREEIQNYGE